MKTKLEKFLKKYFGGYEPDYEEASDEYDMLRDLLLQLKKELPKKRKLDGFGSSDWEFERNKALTEVENILNSYLE